MWGVVSVHGPENPKAQLWLLKLLYKNGDVSFKQLVKNKGDVEGIFCLNVVCVDTQGELKENSGLLSNLV